MSEVNLKPCPFCSGKPKMATCDWGYSVKEYWYYCSYCGCETQKYHSKEDAAEQWNTRKPMDDIVAELERIKMNYFLTIANTGDANNDFAYENVGNALDNAIEIVKGGVEDGETHD